MMRRTATDAPWRGKAKTLPGIPCPECEHGALIVDDGDEHVTCRCCDVKITRKRYDIWSEMFGQPTRRRGARHHHARGTAPAAP